MKKGMLKYLIIGTFAFLKASIPLEGNCPTLKNINHLQKQFEKNYIEIENNQYDTTNIKNKKSFYDLCKENYAH